MNPMLRLPPNIRSLLLSRCSTQCSTYSTAASPSQRATTTWEAIKRITGTVDGDYPDPSNKTSSSASRISRIRDGRGGNYNSSANRKAIGKPGKIAQPKDSLISALAQDFERPGVSRRQSRQKGAKEVEKTAKAVQTVEPLPVSSAADISKAALKKRLIQDQLSENVLKEEKNAKMQIYTYAAAHGLVPKFNYQVLDYRKPQGKRKKLIEVTISLPEQGLEAMAIAPDIGNAEIAAAIKFKQQAEALKESGGSMAFSGNFVAYDDAHKFFQYFEGYVQRGVLNVVTGDEQFGNRTCWVAHSTLKNQQIGEKVVSTSQDGAKALAYLVGANHLIREYPHLLQGFQQALIEGSGDILKPVKAELNIDDDTYNIMREALAKAKRIGLPEMTEAVPLVMNDNQRSPSRRRDLTPTQLDFISQNLVLDLKKFYMDPALEELRSKKESLPMNQYRRQVLQMINSSPYSIVVGATGSGKTTQVPQIVLDSAIMKGHGATCNILCTQPRRIAATSVAQRVAAERNEKLCHTVGYHVRFDKKTADPIGSINFCTTGVLLQQLTHDADQVFDQVSHLIIDEVHERDRQIDFLMIVLKKAIAARQAASKPVPRVVLMSATLDTKLFASYFSHSTEPGVVLPCPSISVPGRTFPVEQHFLSEIMDEMRNTHGQEELDKALQMDNVDSKMCMDYLDSERALTSIRKSVSAAAKKEESIIDWNSQTLQSKNSEDSSMDEFAETMVPTPLVTATIAHICNISREGAVLAFLPGLAEIEKVERMLRARNVLGVDFRDTDRFKVLRLHSLVSPADQAEVFNPVPPGCRKIILSTNIAETSVTIPDVQYVVDVGKLRETRYDLARRITKLQCTWVSKSNSKQRAGRAGRVQNGSYYALFTKERYEMMRTIGLPELLRTDLQETCLSVKMQGFNDSVADFLSQAIEPPPALAVNGAIESLKEMEAFTKNEELTALGRLLSMLPVHPSLGKLVILGVIFRCLDPMLVIGAAAAERDIFWDAPGQRGNSRRAHKAYSAGQQSDHIATLNAFTELRRIRDTHGMRSVRQRIEQMYLHFGAFKAIDGTAKQLHDVLVEVGLVPKVLAEERRDFQYGHPSLNINSDDFALIKALLCAGLSPNLAVRKSRRSEMFRSAKESQIMIKTSSMSREIIKDDDNSLGLSPEEKANRPAPSIMTYGSLSAGDDGSTIIMRSCTALDPITSVLFSKNLQQGDNRYSLRIDEWLPVSVRSTQWGAAALVRDFKMAMDCILTSAFRSLSRFDAQDADSVQNNRLIEEFTTRLIDILNLNAIPVSGNESAYGQMMGQVEKKGSDEFEKAAGFDERERYQIPYDTGRFGNNSAQAGRYATGSANAQSYAGFGKNQYENQSVYGNRADSANLRAANMASLSQLVGRSRIVPVKPAPNAAATVDSSGLARNDSSSDAGNDGSRFGWGSGSQNSFQQKSSSPIWWKDDGRDREKAREVVAGRWAEKTLGKHRYGE